ncbi:dolichol-phosphate mannose synthase subunit 3, partial [Tanacetum coccineum]
LPLYFIVSLECYGLLTVGLALVNFAIFPQELAILLRQDVIEANEFLKQKGVDVGSG